MFTSREVIEENQARSRSTSLSGFSYFYTFFLSKFDLYLMPFFVAPCFSRPNVDIERVFFYLIESVRVGLFLRVFIFKKMNIPSLNNGALGF